jgi:hypothetical protein
MGSLAHLEKEVPMTEKNSEQNGKKTDPQLDKMDSGGHLGGTTFGQTADAKTKDTREGGDKARPNDGSN